MYIVHIIIGLDIGGAELMLKRLLEIHQADPNYRLKVISLTNIGEVGKQLQSLGVDVQSMGMTSLLDIPGVIWRLKNQIQLNQPDIVQTWMYHSDLLGGLAARMAGQKNIVWGIRTTFLSIKSSITTVLIRQLCALMSYWLPKKIICVAQAAKKAHIRLGYDASRIVVVPNGFDLDKFDFGRELYNDLYLACGFSRDDLVIGNVGRFHIDKGQDVFIEAAAIVVQSHPNTKFLLVGKGCDTENAKLVTLIDKLKLQNNVVLLGQRSDIPACLSLMDIFCMPSRTEGFPNGLGEAMASGLPCVVTNVGDAAILTGDTAILTSSNDPLALANGLLEMLAFSNEKRLEMGACAKTRVKNEFSIEKTCQQFSSVYKQLLS